MGVSNLALTGGEPLMRDDLAEIVEHAASCETEHIETVDGSLESKVGPPKIYLLSNGLKVNDATFEMCKKHDVQLSLSLPGLEAFAEHTGVDNVDGVLSCFTAAKEAGLSTVANITVTKLNLDELDRTISAALLAGADQILMNRFLPGGRGLEHADRLLLTTDEVVSMLDTAEAILETAGRFGSLGTEVPKCKVDASKYKRMQVSTRCSAGIDFFVIDPSGYTRVCNHSPIRLVHVDKIADLKTNDYWRRFTQKQYLPPSCMDCDERHDCDGGCREAAHIVGGELTSLDILMMDE
jgi:pyrroloquinoline quinone biosynthesis protein E